MWSSRMLGNPLQGQLNRPTRYSGNRGGEELFERLCRVISLTEQRGFKQVEILLNNHFVREDRTLTRIFEIVHKDEPSHWQPYDAWLAKHARREPRWWERAVDTFVHSELLFLKLPILFLNPWMRRSVEWADQHENNPVPAPVTDPVRPQLAGIKA